MARANRSISALGLDCVPVPRGAAFPFSDHESFERSEIGGGRGTDQRIVRGATTLNSRAVVDRMETNENTG